MSDWDWYPKAKPRRPADGIKAQTQRGAFGKTWWAGRWLAALERLVDTGRLSRGRSYARTGQVLNLDIQSGRVESRVQGSRRSPYKVLVRITPLTADEWARAADAMAEQAIFAAKLLSGEMPPNIEEAFAAAKVSLFPISTVDLQTTCSCPDSSNPCKHIAAVFYLLGEQFDGDPFLLFRLRGKNKDEIVGMLRARRSAVASREPASATADRDESAQTEQVVPLTKCLARFWDAAEDLGDFQVQIHAPAVEAAPVKRLGVPGFWRNPKVDFVALFASAYGELTRASLEAALGKRETRE